MYVQISICILPSFMASGSNDSHDWYWCWYSMNHCPYHYLTVVCLNLATETGNEWYDEYLIRHCQRRAYCSHSFSCRAAESLPSALPCRPAGPPGFTAGRKQLIPSRPALITLDSNLGSGSKSVYLRRKICECFSSARNYPLLPVGLTLPRARGVRTRR